MVHLWSSKAKEDAEMSRCALGECATGDIAIVIGGEKLDSNLVYLGCQMAKGARRKVHFVHVIEVPRTQEGTSADRKSTRLNSSHSQISYAVFCLKKKHILARARQQHDSLHPC